MGCTMLHSSKATSDNDILFPSTLESLNLNRVSFGAFGFARAIELGFCQGAGQKHRLKTCVASISGSGSWGGILIVTYFGVGLRRMRLIRVQEFRHQIAGAFTFRLKLRARWAVGWQARKSYRAYLHCAVSLLLLTLLLLPLPFLTLRFLNPKWCIHASCAYAPR